MVVVSPNFAILDCYTQFEGFPQGDVSAWLPFVDFPPATAMYATQKLPRDMNKFEITRETIRDVQKSGLRYSTICTGFRRFLYGGRH
jgi:hypothetical protein